MYTIKENTPPLKPTEYLSVNIDQIQDLSMLDNHAATEVCLQTFCF